ncbi:MAG: ABC transporter substrate-binding protein, partial [Candidatus Bathyarchaeota archaeon]|nr:ABC transporter substrate-binding protein [Candidatus Bathyarchaeota archaeon]
MRKDVQKLIRAAVVLVSLELLFPTMALSVGQKDASQGTEVIKGGTTTEQTAKVEPYHWATPEEYRKATGKTVGKYKEAPMLKAKVAAKELPPVEERLPKEPLVLGRKIGTYGGTLYTHEWVFSGGRFMLLEDSLAEAEYAWNYNLYPNVLKSWDVLNDGRTWTLHLREGLKWSDGVPYTADDIMFWWEDIANSAKWISVATGQGDRSTQAIMATKLIQDVKRVDSFTVTFEFSKPTDLLMEISTRTTITEYCKHYLSQFHPRYQDKTKLDKMVKDAGFNDWMALLQDKLDPINDHNPERPVLSPWMVVKTPPGDYTMTRNPYYFAVDPEGNQLPYIDQIYMYVGLDPEVINMKALAGELDYAKIDLSVVPNAKEKEKEGLIKVVRWGGTEVNFAQFSFNLTHKDPQLRAIFQDKRFRVAASYAIDRQTI